MSSKRARLKPRVGVLELDHMSNLASQLATLNKRLDRFEKMKVNSVQINIMCGNCAGKIQMPHRRKFPLEGNLDFEQETYLGNPNRHNNLYFNTYNPSWRNHLNFSWKYNQRVAPRPSKFAPLEKKASLEKTFRAFM